MEIIKKLRKKKLFPSNKRTVIIALLVSVLLLFVLLHYPLASLAQRSWLGDDLLYVNLAENLRKGNGLTSDIVVWSQILSSGPAGETIYRYQEWGAVIHPVNNVGFIYPAFLAAVFSIFSAQPPSWYFMATVVNTIISLLVIIAASLFAFKLFDRRTAILTAFAVALLPSLYWYSMQSDPLSLFYLFVILTFALASKASGIKSWLLVGAFAAVAHLTHGSGILLIGSLFLWCLIERRFKDSLFLMLSYISLMLPWFVRNQLFFGDFSLGTSIPASTIFGWFGIKYGASASSLTFSGATAPSFTILQVLSNMYGELTNLYNMGYILLLLFFAICGIYWYRYKRLLTPQFIFIILSILGYIQLAFTTNRATPETRYLMASFLVLLPLSMFGFVKTVYAALRQFEVKLFGLFRRIPTFKFSKIAGISAVLLLMAVMLLSLLSFAIQLDSTNRMYAVTNDEIQVANLLKQQSSQTVLLTNEPLITYLHTGLASMYLHSDQTNVTQIEWLIGRYNVSYVVIYNYENLTQDSRLQFDLLTNKPNVKLIYSSQEIHLFNVTGFVA